MDTAVNPAPHAPSGSTYTPSGVALEPGVYTDPSLLEAEQELIFERTWQLAGHVSALPRRGAYVTARAGNQPVLVVRDENHRLRAYRNVCRHRGSRLLSGSVIPPGPHPRSRHRQPSRTPIRSSITSTSLANAALWTCRRSISPARRSIG